MSQPALPLNSVRWRSDSALLRFLFLIAELAGRFQCRCRRLIAHHHRNRVLCVLESYQGIDPTGPLASQIDRLDAERDRLQMERRA